MNTQGAILEGLRTKRDIPEGVIYFDITESAHNAWIVEKAVKRMTEKERREACDKRAAEFPSAKKKHARPLTPEERTIANT